MMNQKEVEHVLHVARIHELENVRLPRESVQALIDQLTQNAQALADSNLAMMEQTELSAAQVRTIEEKDAEIAAERHAFKNFHRMLCERFCYTHDDVDWKRDQVSLMEFIAQAQAPVAAMPDYSPLFTRIDEAIENYVRHGAVCEFEGQSMIYAATLLEIGNLLGEVAPNKDAATQQHAQAAQKENSSNVDHVASDKFQSYLDASQELDAATDNLYGVAPAQPIAGELPPLPDVPEHGDLGYSSSNNGKVKNVKQHYSAHQVREFAEAYGHQCRAAALEEAAKVVAALHSKISHPMLIGEGRADGAHNALTNAEAAIRALNKTEG